jgi:hypothetical protein
MIHVARSIISNEKNKMFLPFWRAANWTRAKR